MHVQVLTAVCVLLATATDGAHDALFPRWLTRGQLPAPRPPAAAALRQHAVPASEKNTESDAPSTSSLATNTGVPAMNTSVPATNTNVPAMNTSVPTMNTSVPPMYTSVPTLNTNVRATNTTVRALNTSVPALNTSVPTMNTSVKAMNISVPATNTSVLNMNTDMPSTTRKTLLKMLTIPPGYTYYPATGSHYKLYHDWFYKWDVANTTCTSEGAHMVVINDAEEADIVARFVSDTTGHFDWIWTGLRVDGNGLMDWRTVNGEPLSDVYDKWAGGAPQYNVWLTCAAFSSSSIQLFDQPCADGLYFACEIQQ